jgi:hypothetical protein
MPKFIELGQNMIRADQIEAVGRIIGDTQCIDADGKPCSLDQRHGVRFYYRPVVYMLGKNAYQGEEMSGAEAMAEVERIIAEIDDRLPPKNPTCPAPTPSS